VFETCAVGPHQPHKQLRLRKALALLTALFGSGLTLAAPGAVSVSPKQVQHDQPATLRIETAGWQAPAQLALLPGGPFSSHRLRLPTTPLAIASDGQRAWVASHGGWLQVIEFPSGAEALIGDRLKIDGADIQQLRIDHGRLLAAGDDRRVMLFDVSRPAQITQQWSFHAGAPVLDMQLAGNTAWLLLADRRLQRLSLDASAARVEQTWNLPLAASGFAVQDDTALVVGAEGVARLALGTPSASILDRQTTRGTPRRIQLTAGLALVDDGVGGLQVYDAFGQFRYFLFVAVFEQAFAGEFDFQFFKLATQRTVTGFFHAIDNQLIITTRLVQADFGAHQHLVAILRLKFERALAAFKHGAADLC